MTQNAPHPPRADGPAWQETIQLPEGIAGSVWMLRPAGYGWPRHRHREPEINLIAHGRGAYLIKDRRYELLPRTLVWLFPAQDHIIVDASPDLRMWVAVFHPSLLEGVCQEAASRVLLEADPKLQPCVRLAAEPFETLDRLLGLLSEAAQRHETDRLNAGLGYLGLEALAAHRGAWRIDEGSDVHPAVERAAVLLRDEPEPPELAELAKRCGLSVSRLSRLFKAQTGVPLSQYRNRQRIERFLRLYGRGHRRTATQAAMEAGFGSYAQFHRVFRAEMGMSPAAYRKQRLTETETETATRT